jgi:6-phosphogluconolactonase
VRDQASAEHLILPEGAGPRHLDFHPNGKWVYVLCELDGNVVLCDWDTDAGTLSPRQSIYALPDGVVCSRAHHSGCSHIMVSPDGANVYAATRTDGKIATFAVNANDGTLVRVGENVSCGGVCPRNFQFDMQSTPSRLRICNQDSQNVASYAIGEAGALQAEPTVMDTPGMCPQVISVPIYPPTAGAL